MTTKSVFKVFALSGGLFVMASAALASGGGSPHHDHYRRGYPDHRWDHRYDGRHDHRDHWDHGRGGPYRGRR